LNLIHSKEENWGEKLGCEVVSIFWAPQEIQCWNLSELHRNCAQVCAASGSIAWETEEEEVPLTLDDEKEEKENCAERREQWQCALSRSDQKWSQPSLHGQLESDHAWAERVGGEVDGVCEERTKKDARVDLKVYLKDLDASALDTSGQEEG